MNNRRICILADIRVVQTHDNLLTVYKIDPEGIESGDPVHSQQIQNNEVERWYYCRNCGTKSPGEDDFTMRNHLGRFHDMVDPFNYPEQENP